MGKKSKRLGNAVPVDVLMEADREARRKTKHGDPKGLRDWTIVYVDDHNGNHHTLTIANARIKRLKDTDSVAFIEEDGTVTRFTHARVIHRYVSRPSLTKQTEAFIGDGGFGVFDLSPKTGEPVEKSPAEEKIEDAQPINPNGRALGRRK